MFNVFIAMAAVAPAPLEPVSIIDASTRLSFTEPVRLTAGGSPIRTEGPGYAAPALHDIDGDGHKDLVVGQFNNGKLKVYPGKADGTYGEGDWLMADGEVATVPGVW